MVILRFNKITKILSAVFLSLVFLLAVKVGASAADNIRVGLRFGDDAVYSFNASCPSGFSVGFARDSEFIKLSEVPSDTLYAEQGGGVYLISANEYESFEEALSEARRLVSLNIYAHTGYIDGKFYVLSGLFSSNEEAESYIPGFKELSGIDFVLTYMDTKAVFAVMGKDTFVFRNDTDAFCVEGLNNTTITVSGKGEYRGAIMADRTYSKAVSVINLVDLDDYLASVVGSEMYATWHIEALKAQAVIARTYALTRTAYKSYGIDVTDDVRTQAYNGVSRETESTYRAAHETSGMVVKYKGKLAETFFYSMSGGKTADVYSAWGGGADLDYLKSVDDIYEDVENIKSDIWQVTYTRAEIEKKLQAAGVNIGTVTGVKVKDRGEDLRVRKLSIIGTNGEYTLTFDKCRSFFNLRSQYYYVTGSGEEEKATAFVLSKDGVSEIDLKNAFMLSKDGILKLPSNTTVLGAGLSTAIYLPDSDVESDTFVFDGRGNGHGVGMSQYGAWGMAKQGFSYDEIIKFYFTGVEVEEY